MKKPKRRYFRIGPVQAMILHIIAAKKYDGGMKGGDVVKAVAEKAGDVSDAQVYIAIKRMKDQGLLLGEVRDPPKYAPPGNPPRYYHITEAGELALKTHKEAAL